MKQHKQKLFYVLNGPNLNLLGARKPSIYGHTSLKEIEKNLVAKARTLDVLLELRQSNHEGDLIDWIQEADIKGSALIINPGGYTHSSVAIRDALSDLSIPAIEVHLSNIYAREDFRRVSLVSPVVKGVMSGLGPKGYELALEALATKLT